MKKNIKNLLLMVFLFVIAVTLVSANSYELKNNNQLVLIENLIQDKEFIKDQETYLINKYGENYLEIFARNLQAVENANKISNLFPKNNSGEIIYPGYIGGLYINDNEDLVIQIVDANVPNAEDSVFSFYENVFTVDKNAIIENVKYSYAELEKINDELVKGLPENSFKSNISAIYTDVINNRVVVELKNYTNEEIIKFKSTIMNSPLIGFEKGVENTNYANLNPGAKVGSISCSYGYRARLSSTRVGILTAGHCVTSGATISGIGKVNKWQQSGPVDAAWIETISSNTPTNTLAYNYPNGVTGAAVTNVVTFFTVGQLVGKVGQASGWSNGTITSINYTPTGQTTISGLIKTNAWAQPGDSGGFVFGNPTTGALGGYTTMGIIQGGPSSGGNFHFSRADRINSAFGISRY